MKINTYAVNCNDAWLNTESDDISGSYVKYKDHHEVVAALEAKCAALAAENAALKAAFDKPQAYLSWHAIPPTLEDPLPCGEYLDVHDDAGHKNSDGTDCWPVYAKPEIETPATDAFLAEVQAQGVEMVIAYHRERADALHHVDRNNAIRHSMAALDASDVAAQIRQDANTAELVAAGIITKAGG